MSFKKLFLKQKKNVKIGKNVTIHPSAKITVRKNAVLDIHDNCYIGKDAEIRLVKNAKLIVSGNVKIDNGVRIISNNDAVVFIGEKTRIGFYSVLNAGDSITIGRKCLISGFVYLQTSNHNTDRNEFIQDAGYEHGPIVLEDDTWIAAHCTVLPGITMARGSVLGSNAVLTRSTEPYKIYAGVPAKAIKERV